jgi:hypothetical protein
MALMRDALHDAASGLLQMGYALFFFPARELDFA